MMSLRVLTRSIPRSAFKAVTPATSFRSLSTIRQPTLLQSSWTVASKPAYKSFSTTQFRSEPAGQTDAELSQKIQQEVSLELEENDPSALPADLADYLENGPFELKESAGNEEVILTRTFGNETIKVAFSVSDLNELDQEPEMDEDQALYDEDYEQDMQSGGAQSKGSSASAQAAASPEETDEYANEEDTPSFPTRVNITIEKAGQGALQIQAVTQDGTISIQDVFHFAKADLANAQTAEKEWSRRNLYAGPPFPNLDEDLQLLLENYLQERGVDSALANFVPAYIEFKEQKEYVNWLQNMQKFIDA